MENTMQQQMPEEPLNGAMEGDMEQQVPSQPLGVITVDGTQYAVGLMWQSLQNPDDPLPEIREIIESEPGLDLYVLRPASAPATAILPCNTRRISCNASTWGVCLAYPLPIHCS
ncbi:MAG: hypothetical protein IKY98_05780 [Alphaproteobacteria bacterium]|nr:hypothetical protein [Alphaproteobacteria bacterium]